MLGEGKDKFISLERLLHYRVAAQSAPRHFGEEAGARTGLLRTILVKITGTSVKMMGNKGII